MKRGATGNQAGRGESWKQSSQGWATEEIQAGKKDEEPRWVADPVVHLSNALNTALSLGNIAEVHSRGPRQEARTCPWENVYGRRNIPRQRWQLSFCAC